MTQEILNSVMPDRDGVEMTDDFMNVYKHIPDELIRHLEDGDVVERMTGGPEADDLMFVGYWSRGTTYYPYSPLSGPRPVGATSALVLNVYFPYVKAASYAYEHSETVPTYVAYYEESFSTRIFALTHRRGLGVFIDIETLTPTLNNPSLHYYNTHDFDGGNGVEDIEYLRRFADEVYRRAESYGVKKITLQYGEKDGCGSGDKYSRAYKIPTTFDHGRPSGFIAQE